MFMSRCFRNLSLKPYFVSATFIKTCAVLNMAWLNIFSKYLNRVYVYYLRGQCAYILFHMFYNMNHSNYMFCDSENWHQIAQELMYCTNLMAWQILARSSRQSRAALVRQAHCAWESGWNNITISNHPHNWFGWKLSMVRSRLYCGK